MLLSNELVTLVDIKSLKVMKENTLRTFLSFKSCK